jgi:hypothetical protein
MIFNQAKDSLFIEVVIVVMGNHHHIHSGEIRDRYCRGDQPLGPGEGNRGCPLGKMGVGQHIDSIILPKKGGMPNPGQGFPGSVALEKRKIRGKCIQGNCFLGIPGKSPLEDLSETFTHSLLGKIIIFKPIPGMMTGFFFLAYPWNNQCLGKQGKEWEKPLGMTKHLAIHTTGPAGEQAKG